MAENRISAASRFASHHSVPESAPCAPTENPTSRSETQSRALSEDEYTSDDDDNSASIFEPRAAPGSTRSARYTRRMRQRVDEQAPPNRVFFSGFENLLRSVSVYRPRLLICGKRGMGQSTHLAPALLHAAEHVAVRCLDLPTLYGSASKTPEEACAQVQYLTVIGKEEGLGAKWRCKGFWYL